MNGFNATLNPVANSSSPLKNDSSSNQIKIPEFEEELHQSEEEHKEIVFPDNDSDILSPLSDVLNQSSAHIN